MDNHLGDGSTEVGRLLFHLRQQVSSDRCGNGAEDERCSITAKHPNILLKEERPARISTRRTSLPRRTPRLAARRTSAKNSESMYKTEWHRTMYLMVDKTLCLFLHYPSPWIRTLRPKMASFSIHELKEAISGAKKNRSPGEDNIPYEIIQNLHKSALKVLLKIYNNV